MSQTTINDIARMAGVCKSTVSRVINNQDRVNSDTRKRILKLIENTGYHPSSIGRNLSKQRSHSILLMVPNVADPYYSAVSKHISSVCSSVDYKVLLADTDYDLDIEARHLRLARDGSADGLLVSPLAGRANAAYFRDLVDNGFPVVVMDVSVPTVPMNVIKYDDAAGARMAMDYLFDQGHRNIAFLRWQGKYKTVQDRYRGYITSHEKRGLPVCEDRIVALPNAIAEWDNTITDRLMRPSDPPTAILAINEMVAVACMNAMIRKGKRIPHDVAVVAFGDTLDEQLVPVPLTTVALHHKDLTRKAVELLLSLIEQPQLCQQPPQRHVVRPDLIIRESG